MFLKIPTLYPFFASLDLAALKRPLYPRVPSIYLSVYE
jgi:hypothetical protein